MHSQKNKPLLLKKRRTKAEPNQDPTLFLNAYPPGEPGVRYSGSTRCHLSTRGQRGAISQHGVNTVSSLNTGSTRCHLSTRGQRGAISQHGVNAVPFLKTGSTWCHLSTQGQRDVISQHGVNAVSSLNTGSTRCHLSTRGQRDAISQHGAGPGGRGAAQGPHCGQPGVDAISAGSPPQEKQMAVVTIVLRQRQLTTGSSCQETDTGTLLKPPATDCRQRQKLPPMTMPTCFLAPRP